MHTLTLRIVLASACLCMLLAHTALSQELPTSGQTLTPIDFPAPMQFNDKAYLGLGDNASFHLSDLQANIILLEVIGVYCSQCYKQLPSFNRLFKRINRGKLKNRVKMLSVAAGGTQEEIIQLKSTQKYSYPVLKDPDYTIHKYLGQPLTPFTMLLRPNGKILYTHLGIINDIDTFYRTIKNMSR